MLEYVMAYPDGMQEKNQKLREQYIARECHPATPNLLNTSYQDAQLDTSTTTHTHTQSMQTLLVLISSHLLARRD